MNRILSSLIILLFFATGVKAQNIGIGTTSPASKLDVNGAINSASGYYSNTSGSAASSPINVELVINMPNTVASTIAIGNLSITNGAHNIRISVSVSNGGFSVSKMYDLSIGYNGTANVWYQVIPDENSGPYGGNDFAMDISVSNGVASFRLRRTVGSTDGSTANGSGARVRIESVGPTTDVFTATSATASGVTTPTAQYGYKGAVPIGGIILWSGSVASIPAGWQICDGTNSTPNLEDKFIVGAGNSYAVAATGGAATHTHSTPALTVPALTIPALTLSGLSIPSLTVAGLTIPSLTVTGTTNQGTNSTDRVAAINGCCSSYYSKDSHSHTVSGTTTASTTSAGSTGTSTTGSGSTAANSTGTGSIAANTTGSASSLPPYYALAYIIRMY